MVKTVKGVLLLFLIGVILSGVVHSPTYQPTLLGDTPIMSAASGNPHFPVSLIDGVVVSDSYLVADYYYITDPASATYYQLLWLNPTVQAPWLTVYSDAEYSDFMVCTVYDDINWVLLRLSSPMILYPEVHCINPCSGYIMWETVNTTLPFGMSVVGALSADHYVEPYRLSLTAGATYNFTLGLAGTMGDFDLYLYYLTPDEYSEGVIGRMERSRARGWGYGEGFVYQPTVTGEYVVLVALYSGAGPFSLTCTTDQTGDPLDLTVVLIVAGLVGVGAVGAVLWYFSRDAGAAQTFQKKSKINI